MEDVPGKEVALLVSEITDLLTYCVQEFKKVSEKSACFSVNVACA